MPFDNRPEPVAGSRPKLKAVSRRHKDNVYARIDETRFNRYIVHDIARYRDYVASGGAAVYSEAELDVLEASGVSDRLPPRATGYYLDLAVRSRAVRNLIKARPEEMDDLSGEADPSNQLKYSPVPGLLHKYELVLLYVVRACSSWCRYCYRSDFLTGKTSKDTGSIHEIRAYIEDHNEAVERGEITDKPKIREALLSGGDPMVLSNRNLFDYLNGLAEAGLEVIRIGTKEMAFYPERFDDNFLAMLDLFHELHPQVLLAFMVHFTHPDEFLLLGEEGEYVRDESGRLLRNPLVERAAQSLRSRHWITLENQTPIIDDVNDDADVLRLLQQELKRMGVNNHYFFPVPRDRGPPRVRRPGGESLEAACGQPGRSVRHRALAIRPVYRGGQDGDDRRHRRRRAPAHYWRTAGRCVGRGRGRVPPAPHAPRRRPERSGDRAAQPRSAVDHRL